MRHQRMGSTDWRQWAIAHLSVMMWGLVPAAAIAQDSSTLRQQVESIQSVAQVKTAIASALTQLDQCAVGSCVNAATTAICEQIGMLDIRVDGKIFSGGTGWTDVILPISPADLNLMKQIFSQCQPTNYQYWNWGMVLHVAYQPTCAIDQSIRKALGVAPAKRCRP